jgi:NAD(P)-dependent dehydrogenase (short-subunit alcohol dehydrogenase family)
MGGRVARKVALVTGAARGQGRSHALTLAREGADVIAVDICRDYDSADYPMATVSELEQTVKGVEQLDRRAVAVQADVRDARALAAAVDGAVAELGRLNVVVANAGICVLRSWDEVTPQIWRDTLDTNLTGAWNTMTACVPHLRAAGGGSIICIVVGVPDPVFGERVCACVVLLSDQAGLTLDELVAYMRAQDIAPFKLPERLEVFSELPKTAGGKLSKVTVRSAVAERSAAR